MSSVTSEHVRNTRRGGEYRSDRHGHIDEHEFRGWKYNPCFCKHASKDIRLFYQGDGSLIQADESDPQWFAAELDEVLIVKVLGVLGGDGSYMKEITLLNRIMRLGLTMNGRPFLEWEADPRHVEIITNTLGLRRAEGAKTLSSTGKKRSMDEVNNATDLSEDHTRTY